MPPIHRHGDSRVCGATTIVSGQSTVFANEKLVAVNGDPNSHGGGALIAGSKNVFIKVGVVGNIEKSNLPNAIDPTKNVINLIKKIPILLLKIPNRHAKPIQKLSPPYIPAISE